MPGLRTALTRLRGIMPHVGMLKVLLALCACTPEVQPFSSEFLSMGTVAAIRVMTSDVTQASQWSAQIEQEWQQIGSQWYAYGAPDAELPRLNAALARGESLAVSPALVQLLSEAQRLQRLSDGFFDPAIAPMVQAWGMHSAEAAAHTPDPSVMAAWHSGHATLQDLQIHGTQLHSPRRDLKIDLGAIAKGFALDQAARSFLVTPIPDQQVVAQLNLGGQWLILGAEYRLALRAPRPDTRPDPTLAPSALAQVTLKPGESLATSGDYERFVEQQGQRIHHLLDPHTGMPVTHTQMVSVIASSATLADAASTALMAAGPAHWQRIARQMGVDKVLRVDATGSIEVTAAMQARLSALRSQFTLVDTHVDWQ